jgi:hypothetical protein
MSAVIRSDLAFRDHPHIMSAKELGSEVGKVHYLLTFSTIYADVEWVVQKKSKNLLT